MYIYTLCPVTNGGSVFVQLPSMFVHTYSGWCEPQYSTTFVFEMCIYIHIILYKSMYITCSIVSNTSS